MDERILVNGTHNFREFADYVKESYAALVAGIRDERDPTPMVILDTPQGVRMIGVDHQFFAEGKVNELVERFIVPAIGEHGATKVAWVHAGIRLLFVEEPRVEDEVIAATIIDREVSEVWFAPLSEERELGEWERWPVESTGGRLVTPIQEVLR